MRPGAGNRRVSRRSKTGSLPNARVVSGIDGASDHARALSVELFVAGGESVDKLAWPSAEATYLSIIEGAYEGDACFPKFDTSAWTMERREQRPDDLVLEYRRAEPGRQLDGSANIDAS
jgi:dihydrofolate reductase